MAVIFQENTQATKINKITDKLLSIDWYHNVGLKEADTEEQLE